MASERRTQVLRRLEALADPVHRASQARFGINTARSYGISIPALQALAKELKRDHALAQELWTSGIHEGRILASLVDDPRQVTEEQMERWAADFDSWDLCDGGCGNLFDKTPYAYTKAAEWSAREQEFVKRAGFSLMATLVVHDKRGRDEAFLAFLPLIQQEATDERNFVCKAVNWALRQIGKRNVALNAAAIATAQEVQRLDSRAARWIAADALRELRSEAVQKRLRR